MLALAQPAGAAVPVHQTQQLTGSDTASGDEFGLVSAMSGDTLAVSAYLHNGGNGAVYLFTDSGGTWAQTDELDSVSGLFGNSLAIAGSTLVVGAYGHSPDGAVYVYSGSGATWAQTAELVQPRSVNTGIYYGWSVAVSSTGSTLVVGAIGGGNGGGSAYVYKLKSGRWVNTATLTASDEGGQDLFGYNVAFSGSDIVVASPGHDDGAGAVYVFAKSGGTWGQQAELTGSDTTAGDQFGLGALSTSGKSLLVGAPTHGSAAGAAYVFTRTGTSWAQTAELQAKKAAPGKQFGFGGAIAGKTVVVGAQDYPNGGGSAYVFKESAGTWKQRATFTGTDTGAGDAFGRAVALSPDATTVEVGAPGHPDNTLAGAAYLFTIG